MRRTIETPGGPLAYELTRKAVKNLNFRAGCRAGSWRFPPPAASRPSRWTRW